MVLGLQFKNFQEICIWICFYSVLLMYLEITLLCSSTPGKISAIKCTHPLLFLHDQPSVPEVEVPFYNAGGIHLLISWCTHWKKIITNLNTHAHIHLFSNWFDSVLVVRAISTDPLLSYLRRHPNNTPRQRHQNTDQDSHTNTTEPDKDIHQSNSTSKLIA